MDWLERMRANVESTVRGWLRPAPARTEPTEAQLAAGHAQVLAATAQFRDAYRHVATAVAVAYEGDRYLVTSAHATTNLTGASRGFHYEGREYFVVIKDGRMAFAEHLAFNPQGAPCNGNGPHFNAQQGFTDLSLLQLASPARSRTMLYDMQFNPDTAERLHFIMRREPALAPMLRDGVLSAEELDRATAPLPLRYLPVTPQMIAARLQPRTPSAFSIGHPEPAPVHTFGATVSPNRLAPGAMAFRNNPASPRIVQGHSGSLLFDIDRQGAVVPLGIVSGVGTQREAYITPFAHVWEGISRLNGLRTLPATASEALASCRSGRAGWLPSLPFRAEAAPETPPPLPDARPVPPPQRH